MFHGKRHIRVYYYRKEGADYKEYSVTKEVPSYFKIFKCGGNILDRLDVTYEQACMATPKHKYYENMLEILVDDNNRNSAPLSNEKLRPYSDSLDRKS